MIVAGHKLNDSTIEAFDLVLDPGLHVLPSVPGLLNVVGRSVRVVLHAERNPRTQQLQTVLLTIDAGHGGVDNRS